MKGLIAVLSMVAAGLVAMSAEPRAQESAGDDMYLPYGMAIPAWMDLAYPPRPFERSHGRPIPNTIPGANAVAHPGVHLPTRRVGVSADRSHTPTIDPGAGDRGLWLVGGEGIYARNDAALTLSIPDEAIGTTIYAPTHMAAGNSCIETVTAHWRYAGMAATSHGHGFWDWCHSDGTGGWQVFEFMDDDWIDRYVRRLQGRPRYWTQVYKDGPTTWRGLIYNFNLGRWEEKTAIAGLSLIGFTGWSMWESHHLMNVARVCPKLPDIQASQLQVYVDAAWTRLTASLASDTLGPYGQCWVDGEYTFRVSERGDSWLARTSR